MVEITKEPISIERVINSVRNNSSGGVITYIGLIRNNSRGKAVLSVEYSDTDGMAKAKLQGIVDAVKNKWSINDIAFVHRIGELKVGDNNVVVAISAAHRQEGFDACQYAIDQFKEKLPTHKKEIYLDGTWLEV
jgi:molybdopterin synthase catalytic subunit